MRAMEKRKILKAEEKANIVLPAVHDASRYRNYVLYKLFPFSDGAACGVGNFLKTFLQTSFCNYRILEDQQLSNYFNILPLNQD